MIICNRCEIKLKFSLSYAWKKVDPANGAIPFQRRNGFHLVVTVTVMGSRAKVLAGIVCN